MAVGIELVRVVVADNLAISVKAIRGLYLGWVWRGLPGWRDVEGVTDSERDSRSISERSVPENGSTGSGSLTNGRRSSDEYSVDVCPS